MVGVDVSSDMVAVERLESTGATGEPLLKQMLRSLVTSHRHLVHRLKLALVAGQDLREVNIWSMYELRVPVQIPLDLRFERTSLAGKVFLFA